MRETEYISTGLKTPRVVAPPRVLKRPWNLIVLFIIQLLVARGGEGGNYHEYYLYNTKEDIKQMLDESLLGMPVCKWKWLKPGGAETYRFDLWIDVFSIVVSNWGWRLGMWISLEVSRFTSLLVRWLQVWRCLFGVLFLLLCCACVTLLCGRTRCNSAELQTIVFERWTAHLCSELLSEMHHNSNIILPNIPKSIQKTMRNQ